MNDAERVHRLRQMWLERYPDEVQRTGWNVLAFNGWLEQNCPELLNRKQGDSFQHLKSDLNGLWRD